MVEIYLVGKKGMKHWKSFDNYHKAVKYAKKIKVKYVKSFKFEESISID